MKKIDRKDMIIVNALSLGGGVQSSTMVEMVIKGVLPKPDIIVFADTGNDPPGVYDTVNRLKEKIGNTVKFVITEKGDLVKKLLTPTGRYISIPAYILRENGDIHISRRQCTAHYKILPIEKAIREHLITMGLAKRDKRGITIDKNVLIKSWLGITTDEAERMKQTWEVRFENTWPLIKLKMSRQDCIDWLIDNDLPVPQRSACMVCPFHNNKSWKIIKDNYPKEWDHAIRFDDQMRHGDSRFAKITSGKLFIHSSRIPLQDVKFENEKGEQPLEYCDEGYCFV